MKICFMCDLHLPFDVNALQYDVMKWAIADISKNKPDCIVFAGDVTCDGDERVYDGFVKAVTDTDIPFLYIPGNSDLRCEKSRDDICKKASACVNEIKGQQIFAINDCDGSISDEQLSLLMAADDSCIVFMHHPISAHNNDSRIALQNWRDTNKAAMLFYGHEHCSYMTDNSVSLQAMDPDKAIGENPCITYYDTKTKELCKEHYSTSVPDDLYDYMGISCYRVCEQIKLAISKGLKCLELRPNCGDMDRKALLECISEWRAGGGENLSVHLPDVGYSGGKVTAEESYDSLIELVKFLKADRITQHVPLVSVDTVKRDLGALDAICDFMAERFNTVCHSIVIGVENMHMTAKDTPDDNRRFGYIPEECLEFMQRLSARCKHKVGINFDIGHARNNMPFSQKYQISTWFSQVGKYIVGYHMHQVTFEDDVYENHMPITDIYGKLISYASFFRCWDEGRVNKAPVVFEMRPDGSYETTLNVFEKYKNKKEI